MKYKIEKIEIADCFSERITVLAQPNFLERLLQKKPKTIIFQSNWGEWFRFPSGKKVSTHMFFRLHRLSQEYKAQQKFMR